MGAGFWIIQATFAIAAIGTAVQVERQRRREEQESGSPPLKVPVEGEMSGIAQFTRLEQSRLLLLRRFVLEARAYRNRLYDDLVPDTSESFAALESDSPASPPRAPRRWTWQAVLLGAGLVLLSVGLLGILRTNADMEQLESSNHMVHPALLTRLLPGMLANPAKYLAAVNSANSTPSSISSSTNPFAMARMLDLKRTMDRFEALLGFGVLLLLVCAARGQPKPDPAMAAVERRDQSSVGRDLIPFLGLLATACALLSFFELP